MRSQCARAEAESPLPSSLWTDILGVHACERMCVLGGREPQGGGVFQFQGKQIFKCECTKQGKLGMIICITKGFFVSPKDSRQNFFK